MKKQKKKAKANEKIKEEGFVFETESHSFSKSETEKAAKEIADEGTKSGFDPFFITEKIIEFGKLLTGIPLYDYQYGPAYRVIFSVINVEGATLSMLFSRQSGKTEDVAFIVDTLTVILPALAQFIPELDQYKDGIKIGLFAPQSEQVTTTYSRCMSRLNTDTASEIMADPDIETYLESDVRLELSNGSYLTGQTASKQSKIESKTYDLVFIEEAQDTDSLIVQKSIEPMCTATNGTIVKIGTTGTEKNHFWYTIQDNRKNDRKVKDPRLVTHFENDYKKVIESKRRQFNIDGKKFHLNYEAFVLRKKKEWGEHSDPFRLAYALIWALESGMFVTDREYEGICNRKMGLVDPDDIKREWLIAAGLDIAKTDASTVLTIGAVENIRDADFENPPQKRILAWIELHDVDYEAQHNIIMDAMVDFEVDILFADYTGVGKPVVDRLQFACGDAVMIVPYTFSRPSKSDMWQNLQADIKARRLIVPANKEVKATEEYQNFEMQMKNLTKWYEGSYLVAEKSDGYRDDYCDSLALMCLAGNYPLPEDMEEEGDNFLIGNGSKKSSPSYRDSTYEL